MKVKVGVGGGEGVCLRYHMRVAWTWVVFYFQQCYQSGGWWASGVHSDLASYEGRITLVMDFTSEKYRMEGVGLPVAFGSRLFTGHQYRMEWNDSVRSTELGIQVSIHGNKPLPLHSSQSSSTRDEGSDQKKHETLKMR